VAKFRIFQHQRLIYNCPFLYYPYKIIQLLQKRHWLLRQLHW